MPQRLFADHCIAGTAGAELAAGLTASTSLTELKAAHVLCFEDDGAREAHVGRLLGECARRRDARSANAGAT